MLSSRSGRVARDGQGLAERLRTLATTATRVVVLACDSGDAHEASHNPNPNFNPTLTLTLTQALNLTLTLTRTLNLTLTLTLTLTLALILTLILTLAQTQTRRRRPTCPHRCGACCTRRASQTRGS